MKPSGLYVNYWYEQWDAWGKMIKRLFGLQLFYMNERMRKGPENRQKKHDKTLKGVHGYTPEELR